MTWLHFLKDCAWINKMLNASIKSLATIHWPLSTIHYSLSHAPAPYDDTDHTGRNRGVSGKAARLTPREEQDMLRRRGGPLETSAGP